MKFGSQQCSIELSVVVVFNDDSSHWHTFHQTAAATSAQINFTISTACTTKRIRDSSIVCSIKPKIDDQFFVGLRVLCDWQTLLPFQTFVILNRVRKLACRAGHIIASNYKIGAWWQNPRLVHDSTIYVAEYLKPMFKFSIGFENVGKFGVKSPCVPFTQVALVFKFPIFPQN